MSKPIVVDLYPEFADWWQVARELQVPRQVQSWAGFCGTRWPELLRKQQRAYASSGTSWRRVAERRVFPGLSANWGSIELAHRRVRQAIPLCEPGVRELLGFRGPIVHVIHLGIGCGAGWTTRYQGRPAILYGLENAAEAGWTSNARVRSLVSHELAHAAHAELRRRAGLEGPDDLRGPYARLYVEGFATQVERRVHSDRNARGFDRDPDWRRWCEAHRRPLAVRFLRAVRDHASLRAFFGSWYSIGGRIETGYWLGAEIVRSWEDELELREIARVPAGVARARVRRSLRQESASAVVPG